jgi:copper chaperone CopZ
MSITTAASAIRPRTTRTVLRSDEFTCPSCVGKIEKRLRRMPGVITATVHFSTGRVEVEHDSSQAAVADLVTAIGEAGYHARRSDGGGRHDDSPRRVHAP